MTAYVDASTLVKLFVTEDGSDRAREIWESTSDRVASVTLVVEASAALAAARRGRRISEREHAMAKRGLAACLAQIWLVTVDEDVAAHAARLAETEKLRGYDAVHLAAALRTGATHLTSADDDLCLAAQRCGLAVLNPLDT